MSSSSDKVPNSGLCCANFTPKPVLKNFNTGAKIKIVSDFSQYEVLDDDIGTIGKLLMRSIKWCFSNFPIHPKQKVMVDFCFGKFLKIRVFPNKEFKFFGTNRC